MTPVTDLPRTHLFVCSHRRDDTSPLGPGCGARGDEVFEALKDDVARRGAFRDVWVTRTACLGVCPKQGCTVAVYPAGKLFRDVRVEDASELMVTT
jgi:predicted metal-binding protein